MKVQPFLGCFNIVPLGHTYLAIRRETGRSFPAESLIFKRRRHRYQHREGVGRLGYGNHPGTGTGGVCRPNLGRRF